MNEERKKMVTDHQKVLKAQKRRQMLDKVADIAGGGLLVIIFLGSLFVVLNVLVGLWNMGWGLLSFLIVASAVGSLIWLLVSSKTDETLKEAERGGNRSGREG